MRLIPTFLLAFGLSDALESQNRVARAAHHFGLGGHTNKPKPSKAPKPPKPSKAPKPPRPSNQNNNNSNNNSNNSNNNNSNNGGKIVAPPCPPEWKPNKCNKKQ